MILDLGKPHIDSAESASVRAEIETKLRAIDQITDDMKPYHPRVLLLFGSMARYLLGSPRARPPNDIDILVVGSNRPFGVFMKNYGVEVDLIHFRIDRFVKIAKSLRYDTRFLSLSKLYLSNLLARHARDIIAASILLGPRYNDFGIEQIEVDAMTDTRDYSAHIILLGDTWWDEITAYARNRRGPAKRLSDKIVHQSEFSP